MVVFVQNLLEWNDIPEVICHLFQCTCHELSAELLELEFNDISNN